MTSIALITGTSSGIGLALARDLLDRGWEVAGLSRRASPIDHPQYHHARIDLADRSATESALPAYFTPLCEREARTTVALVNNAATPGGFTGLEAVTAEELQRSLAVNCVRPIWLMGFVARLAPPEARLRIVTVSSGAATQGFPGLSLYGASKAALRLAGQSLAAEWASRDRPGGPRPNAAILSYEPGVVDTEIQTFARTRSKSEFPWVQMFVDFEAQGRLVAPERVTGPIVAFLEDGKATGFRESRWSA